MDLQQLANLCEKHRGKLLPPSTVDVCTECQGVAPASVPNEISDLQGKIHYALGELGEEVTADHLDHLDLYIGQVIQLSRKLRMRLRAIAG